MTKLEKGNPRGTGSLVTVHWRLVTLKCLVDQFLKLWRISKEISQVCEAEKAAKLGLKIEGVFQYIICKSCKIRNSRW